MNLLIVFFIGFLKAIKFRQKNQIVKIANKKTIFLDPVDIDYTPNSDQVLSITLQTSCQFKNNIFTFSKDFTKFCENQTKTYTVQELSTALKSLALTQDSQTTQERFIINFQFTYDEQDGQQKTFTINQNIEPFSKIPIKNINPTLDFTKINTEQYNQQILDIDTEYLQLSSQQNIEVKFDPEQPSWLTHKFQENSLILIISSYQEVSIKIFQVQLKDKITMDQSEVIQVNFLMKEQNTNKIQKFLILFLFTLFTILAFLFIIFIIYFFKVQKKKENKTNIESIEQNKDEEFLSNSIVQWNKKMKLRQRTLNLEEEEIHDGNEIKMNKARSHNNLDDYDTSQDQQEEFEQMENYEYEKFDEEKNINTSQDDKHGFEDDEKKHSFSSDKVNQFQKQNKFIKKKHQNKQNEISLYQ